jgi:hypothetical protein
MVANVGIDAVLGVVPVVGDLFDFAWKANDRNLALLESHIEEVRPARPGDWLFVGAIVVLLAATAVAPFVVLGWLVNLLTG